MVTDSIVKNRIPNQIKARKNWSFSLLEGGLPQGALIEMSGLPGHGKTEVVLKFLSENSQLRVAWVEENLTIYPCAFPQNQVSLNRVLFVETPRYLWAVQQILRSQIFGVIVLSTAIEEEIVLRRLQLAAEQAQSSVILLCNLPKKEGTWPISVQLQIQRCPQTQVPLIKILKYRGERKGDPKEEPKGDQRCEPLFAFSS